MLKNINILITGIGRRIELCQAFREAALYLDVNVKIYGTDIAGTAPALIYCDFIRKICGMKDPDYIKQLLKICLKDNIDLIVPTIDTDLLVLSENKDIFEKHNIKVLISDKDKISICRDKNNTSAFFENCGLKAPKTYNDYKKYNNYFPCFIKPKDGSSSINAFKIKDKAELKIYAEKIDDYVIQPFIEGKEYTIDIFCDFDGNPIYITPRERLQVRAGEVLKTQISNDKVMIEESKRICEKFRPCGPITVQLIKDNKTGDNYYIEINPRFGGGAPLSMKSGAKSLVSLFNILLGNNEEYKITNNTGAVYSRFDQSVCISNYESDIKGYIFDLDDTLYNEKEYIKSGYRKIAEYLNIPDAELKLWDFYIQGKAAIDEYLKSINKIDLKEKCLEIYRNQYPDIELTQNIKNILKTLKNKGYKLGIITDGRPNGQHNKINALKLNEYADDIIITDELGGVQFRKPNDVSFRIMQNRWKLPNNQIVYIGDNPNKDFQAPLQLGMNVIYYKNKNGLYSYDDYCFGKTITDLNQILQ